MSLSVCLITGAPAGRIAAVLAPVRELADEIVIAADSRVDEPTLAGYVGLADRVFRIEYEQYERHLAWLHAQCSGDWILRLDHDEVVSRALVARLPAMMASRDVQQYWIRRAWVYPGPDRVLDELPWSVDFNNRLVRNDATLDFGVVQHASADPVDPREYVEAPLYHLELLVSDVAARRDKAIRYEILTPGLVAPGGGRLNEAFYLPELREGLRSVPVPDEDRAAVAAVLDCRGPVAPRSPHGVPLVGRDELDWHRRGGPVPESGYRAAIEPAAAPPSLAPGEGRIVLFHVTNRGTALWRRGLDADPPILVSYRWRRPDGAVHTADGLRTGFSRAVRPGDRILVPLELVAPDEPGRYILEVDLVHEHVRWFDQPCHVEVEVRPRAGLPPAPLRLRETPPRRPEPVRAGIPRTLHRMALGGEGMPDAHAALGRALERDHPGWRLRLWTDADLGELALTPAERARARSPAELADAVRLEVLARQGGVCLGAGAAPPRSLDALLDGVEAFAVLEGPGRVGTTLLGAVPGHPAFVRAASLARETLGLGAGAADASGSYGLSLVLEQEPGVTIFDAGALRG